MKVLILGSEMAPFVKSGGLGDVIGSLPYALATKGVEISVFIPKYNSIDENTIKNSIYVCSTEVIIGNTIRKASIYKVNHNNVNIYFVKNDHYFNRYGLYGFDDDIERYIFFNRATLCTLEIIDFKPDIVHLNDWQTSITALYLKDKFKEYPFYQNIKTLMTIHNIQYQGVFPEYRYYSLGVSRDYWNPDGVEFYNKINLLKTGLKFADAISTVSKTYAREIMTNEFGYGLDGVIRSREKDTYGILNGIDYNKLNLDANKSFSPIDSDNFFEIKAIRKQELQELCGLPQIDVPIYAIISRFADQKGLDLVTEQMIYKDVQFVVLGTGDTRLEHKFINLQERFPHKFRSFITFDVDLSNKIYAGSDFFLMPSLFEPCGLGQIFAMNFGTLPIVRNTGGLADTVQHYNYDKKNGNGIVFNDFLSSALEWAINESLHLYRNKEHFQNAVLNAKNSLYSWDKSADEYISLYKKIISQS